MSDQPKPVAPAQFEGDWSDMAGSGMKTPLAKPVAPEVDPLHESDLRAIEHRIAHCRDVGSTTAPVLLHQLERLIAETRAHRAANPEQAAAKLPPVGVVTGGWTPMLDAHGQLNVPEGEFCIFHAKPKDNDAEGYFCDSLVWDAETSPQWRDGEHGWDIDDVCEFHPMPARGAAAKPPAGVEVAEALDALDSLASSIRCSPREYLEYYKEEVDTIRSALEKCR